MVTIKRERFRRKNKKSVLRIVVRDKGRIVTSAKWSRQLTLEKAKRVFKQNNTLVPDLTKEKLSKQANFSIFNQSMEASFEKVKNKIVIKETTIKKPRRGTEFYQYLIIATIMDRGRVISVTGASTKFFRKSKQALEQARLEAYENFYKALSNAVGKNISDPDEGREIFISRVTTAKEVVRSYVKKRGSRPSVKT